MTRTRSTGPPPEFAAWYAAELPGICRALALATGDVGLGEEAAWPLFSAGHLPMFGEWVALPGLSSAGASGPLDPLASQVMYPTAERLLAHCDAVLRLPGESRGADQDVAIATERGLPVYYRREDVPGVGPVDGSAL